MFGYSLDNLYENMNEFCQMGFEIKCTHCVHLKSRCCFLQSEKAFIRRLTQDENLEQKELSEKLLLTENELLKLRKIITSEVERFANEISSAELKKKLEHTKVLVKKRKEFAQTL
jgi:hypothetical protein